MEMITRLYPNEWVSGSLMYARGVGGGSSGVTHELTEEMQGTYHYTIGPYSEPVLHIAPGDRVVVETRDAFEGKLTSESDVPSEILEMPWLNPQCGPIMVDGAEKGDVLAVHIEKMLPRGPNPRGTCCMIKEFGALTGTALTATLNEPLPEKVRKIELDESNVYWSDRVTLPYRPHIGTLQLLPRDRFDQLADAGQPRREHGPARHGAGHRHLPAGALSGGAPLHRRRPRLPGRRRGVRGGGRVSDHHHHHRRSHQGMAHRVATSRGGRLHHGDRQHAAARGRGRGGASPTGS